MNFEGYIKKTAAKLEPIALPDLDFDDLCQIGRLSAFLAADKARYKKYIFIRIRSAMIDAIREKNAMRGQNARQRPDRRDDICNLDDVSDLVGDISHDPEAIAMCNQLVDIMSKHPSKIKAYYGLSLMAGKGNKEISNELCISEGRGSQIKKEIIKYIAKELAL